MQVPHVMPTLNRCERVTRGLRVMRFRAAASASSCFESTLQGDVVIPIVHCGTVRMELKGSPISHGKTPFALLMRSPAGSTLSTTMMEDGILACCGIRIDHRWLASIFSDEDDKVMGGATLLDRLGWPDSPRVVPLTARSLMLVRDLSEGETGQGIAGVATSQARVLELLGSLLTQSDWAGSCQSDQRDLPTLEAVRRRIEADPSDQSTISELARQHGLSPTRLKAGFRGAFGTSIHQFIIAARLDAAEKMLRETCLPVSQIAYRIGYSPAHFSTLFSRRFGLPPSSYGTAGP